jgi:preprotein translocase subunit SecG
MDRGRFLRRLAVTNKAVARWLDDPFSSVTALRCDPNCKRSANLQPVETILSVLQVIISVIVVFLVLMHSGKDSGLSGAFGVGSGTGPLGGGSLVERNLNRWTVFFAVLFIINAIILLKRPLA